MPLIAFVIIQLSVGKPLILGVKLMKALISLTQMFLSSPIQEPTNKKSISASNTYALIILVSEKRPSL